MTEPTPAAGELTIDEDICQGHGRCYALFPELFAPKDDDGKAAVLEADVEGSRLADAQQAVRECPERAIAVRPRR